MKGDDHISRGRAQHGEGLKIIESVLGRGETPVLGLYMYTAVAVMLDDVRRSPKLRKISPHLIGTPSILLVRPQISQSELARYLGCPRATAGKQVMACVRHGWVSRRRSTEDRRLIVLELTAAGRRMLKEVASIVTEHEQMTFAALSKQEQATLRQLLLRFIVG
jgi:DNA-binding MarR family transcriptional regulator